MFGVNRVLFIYDYACIIRFLSTMYSRSRRQAAGDTVRRRFQAVEPLEPGLSPASARGRECHGVAGMFWFQVNTGTNAPASRRRCRGRARSSSARPPGQWQGVEGEG